MFLFSSLGSNIPRDRSSHPICDFHVGVISSFFIWFWAFENMVLGGTGEFWRYNGSDIWSFTKWKKDLGANRQAAHPHKAYRRSKDAGVEGGVVRRCSCVHGHLLDAMQVLLLASKPAWWEQTHKTFHTRCITLFFEVLFWGFLFLFSSFGSNIPRDRSNHPICDSHVGVISSFLSGFRFLKIWFWGARGSFEGTMGWTIGVSQDGRKLRVRIVKVKENNSKLELICPLFCLWFVNFVLIVKQTCVPFSWVNKKWPLHLAVHKKCNLLEGYVKGIEQLWDAMGPVSRGVLWVHNDSRKVLYLGPIGVVMIGTLARTSWRWCWWWCICKLLQVLSITRYSKFVWSILRSRATAAGG